MSSLKLTHGETLRLIKIYRENECLWNFNNDLYKKADIKHKIWLKIANEYNCTVEDIKRKVKYLRTTYLAVKKKVEDSQQNGSGESYEPNLFYFNELAYLDKAIICRKRKSNVEKKCFDSDSEDYSNDMDDEILPAKKIKVRDPIAIDDAFKDDNNAAVNYTVNNPIKSGEDQFDFFGKSIAAQLKNLPPINAIQLMARIQSMISAECTSVLMQNRNNISSEEFISTDIM